MAAAMASVSGALSSTFLPRRTSVEDIASREVTTGTFSGRRLQTCAVQRKADVACRAARASVTVNERETKVEEGTRPQGAGDAARTGLRAEAQGDATSWAAGDEEAPLLVRAARGDSVPRPPCWMMRQAGRYQAVYRDLARRHPSFRERSEKTELIVEISLQPWEAFQPDGVIIFSDILTPLPALGIPFEIDDARGPILDAPIRSQEDLKRLHELDLSRLQFVADSLTTLRKEVGGAAAVLGFVGAPWTLATYCVEGKSTRTYTLIKSMAMQEPQLLKAMLKALAEQVATYAIFQIEAGAQCIQIFDSWGGQLPPDQWDEWSRPYVEEVVRRVKAVHPEVPLVLYCNGSGGLLERMGSTGADVIGLDWTVDMADARQRLGSSLAVQGNVDPAVLFSSPEAITEAVQRVVRKAGPRGHILNLGHGVLPETPEENVRHFFRTAREVNYGALFPAP
eukprot:TRINITY_DN3249_c0_g1_i1.p1 TRINITY_DN3249_c0_g1~~TRINITY_DN3249_c0_g1_i1.p1  ORF type:complete len:453 (+),score=104.85 TRINITY_DN3249_c0_g1_i1:56-1414(+)